MITPTQDGIVHETEWFVNPANPLLEYKVYFAKKDSILFYVTAKRGPTDASLKFDEVIHQVDIGIDREYADNSEEQLKTLRGFLNKPVK